MARAATPSTLGRGTSRGVFLLALSLTLFSCAGADETADSELRRPPIDCEDVDASDLSPFVVDPFQRDLAIDTPSRVTAELDETPELICRTLESSRLGELSPIAYAAAHRPDAELLFPLLIERGAEAADALPVAAHLGKSRLVEWLLEEGVDPDSGDALVLAAEARHVRVVMTLLDAGADPSRAAEPGPWLGHAGQTALHYAARHGIPELLTALLEAGADVDAADALGRPPLCDAIEADQVPAIRQLIEYGAGPHRLPLEDAERLLAIAKRWRMTELVEQLE